MNIFDDIEADAEKGTPGPWQTGSCTWDEDTGDVQYALTGVKKASPFDCRRIARVPQLERIALAAVQAVTDLSIAADNIRDAARTDPRWEGVEEKLRARIRAFQEASK